MSQITIRNLDSLIDMTIRAKATQEKKSLNEVCTELLGQALGIERNTNKKRDMSSLAGSWSNEDSLLFEKSQRGFEKIDEELWI